MTKIASDRIKIAIAFFVWCAFAVYCSKSSGGQRCAQAVKIHHAQPVVKAATFAYTQPVVLYAPNAQAQQAAAQQYAMETSPEWAQFQQYKLELRAQAIAEKMIAERQQQAGQPAAQQQQQPVAPVAASPPVAQPPATGYAAKTPTLVAKCGGCHTGADAPANHWFDGTVDLRSAELIGSRDAALDEIVNGRMPKGKDGHPPVPLSGEEVGAVLFELYVD